jgi:hypothetical protein
MNEENKIKIVHKSSSCIKKKLCAGKHITFSKAELHDAVSRAIESESKGIFIGSIEETKFAREALVELLTNSILQELYDSV